MSENYLLFDLFKVGDQWEIGDSLWTIYHATDYNVWLIVSFCDGSYYYAGHRSQVEMYELSKKRANCRIPRK